MLFSSSNRKYPPFPLLSYFSVVVEMFVTSYSVTYCIHIPGKPGICFHYNFAVYNECKWSDTFRLKIVFVYFYITPSHYHHCAILSEDNELIKCLSDIFCRVWKIRYMSFYILMVSRSKISLKPFWSVSFLCAINSSYIFRLPSVSMSYIWKPESGQLRQVKHHITGNNQVIGI